MKSELHLSKLSYLVVLLATASLAFGGDQPRPKKSSSFPLLQEAMISKMLDQTARTVARHYDLAPDQAKVAREILEQNCWTFISKHFDELAELLPQMAQMRGGGDPSAAEVQKWAKRYYPIFREAGNLVISENKKFHEVLDERQKKIHDRDIKDARRTIKRYEKRLKRWRTGGYRPGELGTRRSRRTPASKSQTYDKTSLEFWEMYVKMFIEAYQLDKSQQTMAYSVLGEIKRQAEAYRRDHWREFDEARRAINTLTQAKTTQPAEQKQKELAKWEKQLEELNKPLLDLFAEFQQELMKIPTHEQIRVGQKALEPQPEGGKATSTSRQGGAKTGTATK